MNIVEELKRRQARSKTLDKKLPRLKKPLAILYPTLIERAYAKKLSNLFEKANRFLLEAITPTIEKLCVHAEQTTPEGAKQNAEDYYSQYVKDLTKDLKKHYHEWEQIFGGVDALMSMFRTQGTKVADWNKYQVTKSLNTMIGFDIMLEEPYLETQMEFFTTQNLALIQGLQDEVRKKLHSTLMREVQRGSRVEDIRDIIKDDLKVSKSRASLIARDQMGKFHGQLTKLRQSEAGITEYIWHIVGDARTRPMHRALKGKTFSWDKPPVTNPKGGRNHPGSDYQCRCWAEAIIDLDD